MPFQTIFKRYETKYLLTEEQRQRVLQAMEPHMVLDQYGRSVVRSVYLDTPNYRLIRHSLEGPAYKEKLRVRSYGQADLDSTVFVELKKKYKGVVYKRRIALPEREAADWLLGKRHCQPRTQITAEVDYFLQYYQCLQPAALVTCEREAFCTREPSDFRVTFDDTILFRQEDLSLESDVYGTPLLPEGMVLMEVKCSGGMPLWMTHVLSEEGIYKTSFSKYGTAYRTQIFPQLHPEVRYA